MRKCPKCKTEMKLIKEVDSYKMIKQKIYKCSNCGYVEKINEYK